MGILQRLIHDFDRLTFHYDIVTLYALFFQHVLPLIGLVSITLGLLVAGIALPDSPSQQRRAFRRVALAGLLSALGMGLYTIVPLWLDSAGISPVPGHLRFYGMFFLPVGALAGALAVLVGSRSSFTAPGGKPRLVLFSPAGYTVGFITLWLVFLLYSRVMLGSTMILNFALIRATVTAALGAFLFAFAPFLVGITDRSSRHRLLSWGYGLVLAGSMSLILAQVVTQVLTLHSDIL